MSFRDALTSIPTPDAATEAAARERQGRLLKPPGSMGRLEELAIRLAGIQATTAPHVERPVIVVVAASHGIVEAGVSAYPAAVTAQMVQGFLQGSAAINQIADTMNLHLRVVDAGVEGELPDHGALYRWGDGTGGANFLEGPALTPDRMEHLLTAGFHFGNTLMGQGGADLLALGDMGIGNTTVAAAVTASCTEQAPEAVVGRGTGVDDTTFERKVDVVRRSLERHRPQNAEMALSCFGGPDFAFHVGLMVSAATNRVPVLLDGYPTTAAALLAVGIAPAVAPYLIASHQSVEPGHRHALAFLGLEPILDLNLRLGEGTGAALAIPLLRAAVACHNGMLTFEEAGVEGPGAD